MDFTGRSDHSGACPMDLRSDALVGAALTIAEVERLGRSEASSRSVATVGTINVPHQAMNVVPGACTIHVDIRGIDRSSMERIYAGLRDFLQKLREERGLKIEETLLSDEYPVPMDRHLGEIIERNCKKTGLSCRWMPSGAGHDAMNVAKLAPSAMIFIPCVGGISHNLKENVLEKDLRNSIQILYEVVMDICR
ncbi:MAG: M20/M25/M40 family metallo-hydrolase [Firmicutes bacterium]|nr:M20/M25/M40 family metallo-hydrolase [Bacillota bacterium]